MLSVSEGFKNSISQLDVYSDGKIDIINSVGTLSYDKDSISKFEIFGTAFSNDKVLGNLAQHSLTLEIFGDLTKNIPLSLENRIQARIGVLVGGVYEYVQFQDFLITNVSYSDTTNVTMITATDNLLKLNVEFVDTNIYPMTLIAYATSVLTYCGLSLENTTFLNDDFVIVSKPFVNGTLAKDIISRIAELALCFVQVKKTNNKVEFLDAFSPFTFGYTHGGLEGYTYDELGTFTYDELEFISYQGLSSFTHQELASYTHYDLAHFFNQSDEDITKDEYWSLKLSDYPYGRFGYNTVVLKTSEVEGENVAKQEDGMVASDGNIPLTIVDNDLINTEAKRLSVINTIYDHILGYKYYPYTLEYRGFPYLELGDVVVINKIDDTPIYSPIYEMIIRYDGGLYGKLQAEALSLTQSKYLNTKPLSQRVKTAEIKVDKVEGKVTIMAGDYYNGILQGTYYNFDGDAFTITNADSEVVFSADSLGNLTLIGEIHAASGNVGNWFISDGNLKTSDGKLILDATNGRIIIDDYTIDSAMVVPPFGTTALRTLVFSGGLYMNFNANVVAYTVDTWALHNCNYVNPDGNSSDYLTSSRVGMYDYPYLYGYFKNLTLLDGGTLYKLTRDSNGFVKATSLADSI